MSSRSTRWPAPFKRLPSMAYGASRTRPDGFSFPRWSSSSTNIFRLNCVENQICKSFCIKLIDCQVSYTSSACMLASKRSCISLSPRLYGEELSFCRFVPISISSLSLSKQPQEKRRHRALDCLWSRFPMLGNRIIQWRMREKQIPPLSTSARLIFSPLLIIY